jgi:hypothetical protein
VRASEKSGSHPVGTVANVPLCRRRHSVRTTGPPDQRTNRRYALRRHLDRKIGSARQWELRGVRIRCYGLIGPVSLVSLDPLVVDHVGMTVGRGRRDRNRVVEVEMTQYASQARFVVGGVDEVLVDHLMGHQVELEVEGSPVLLALSEESLQIGDEGEVIEGLTGRTCRLGVRDDPDPSRAARAQETAWRTRSRRIRWMTRKSGNSSWKTAARLRVWNSSICRSLASTQMRLLAMSFAPKTPLGVEPSRRTRSR